MNPLIGMTNLRVAALCILAFGLGAWWAPAGFRESLAQPSSKKDPPALPAGAGLGADVYLQTSAEYVACCVEIYRCAASRLETLLRSGESKAAKPAVIMDLDETVFDNAAFQTYLYANKLNYSDALWQSYEEQCSSEVTLVPGAKDFISFAESRGVTVVYLSNRFEKNARFTIDALERNGINVADIKQRLYLRPVGAASDKSARRDQIFARYNVVLLFGDNLRDFSEAFAAKKLAPDAPPRDFRQEIDNRKMAVEEAKCHWGIDWFVLPNPVYGEWERLIPADPLTVLRPSGLRP